LRLSWLGMCLVGRGASGRAASTVRGSNLPAIPAAGRRRLRRSPRGDTLPRFDASVQGKPPLTALTEAAACTPTPTRRRRRSDRGCVTAAASRRGPQPESQHRRAAKPTGGRGGEREPVKVCTVARAKFLEFFEPCVPDRIWSLPCAHGRTQRPLGNQKLRPQRQSLKGGATPNFTCSPPTARLRPSFQTGAELSFEVLRRDCGLTEEFR